MLEKLLMGLAVTSLGALLLYTFRVKQLYVLIPRLFSVSMLTTNGKIVEIRTYNKGRSPEEDIQISLDPSLKYEIVASSDSTCKLESSAVKIPRIPPGDDFSVLLLIEGGDFSKERLSTISSKTTKGKLLKDIDNIPPNAGNFLLSVILFISMLVIPVVGMEYYYKSQRIAAEKVRASRLAKLDFLTPKGWVELEDYSASDFRKNYHDGEFPIHQTKIERKGDIVEIHFRIVNKAATELKVSALSEWPYKSEDPKRWDERNIFSHKVEPHNANDLKIKLYFPKLGKGEALINFQLSFGNESLIVLPKKIHIDV